MFAKSIVLTDAFLDMPMSARCLYFTLGMLADDDGFVGSPKSVMRQCGASQDDMNILISKRFVLCFESGVIVIKHWRINNYLRNDTYRETNYKEEKATLQIAENGSYTERIRDVYTDKYSIDKNSIDKISIDKESDNTRFKPPTIEEVQSYCQERKNGIDAESFIDYYTARNWMLGKVKMKDWKAAVRTWERNNHSQPKSKEKQYTTAADYKPPVANDYKKLQKLIDSI